MGSSPLESGGRPSCLSSPGGLTKYEAPDIRRGLVQLLATILPFLALWVAMLGTLSYGYWLTLLLAMPTAGFLVRLFMLQHDCAHRSFVRSPATNDVLGMVIGLFTLTPHYYWRRLHLMHHATSGNLDRRGYGDIDTLTVNEYLRLCPFQRFMYHVYRHPLVLFGVAPTWHFVVRQRFCPYRSARWKRERASVHATNVALIALLVVLSLVFGFKQLLLVQMPIVALASSMSI